VETKTVSLNDSPIIQHLKESSSRAVTGERAGGQGMSTIAWGS